MGEAPASCPPASQAPQGIRQQGATWGTRVLEVVASQGRSKALHAHQHPWAPRTVFEAEGRSQVQMHPLMNLYMAFKGPNGVRNRDTRGRSNQMAGEETGPPQGKRASQCFESPLV